MKAGHNHHLLERRISAALLSGNARPKEATFLHKMSARILARGKNASLTDAQARWLFALLERLKPTRPPPPSPPKPAKLPGDSPSESFAFSEVDETPSFMRFVQQGPPEPTRNPTPPPPAVTSRPTESTPHLVKPKAPRQIPPTRPVNTEKPDDWLVKRFASLEARRQQREIWLNSKKYCRLYHQPIGSKDISSD